MKGCERAKGNYLCPCYLCKIEYERMQREQRERDERVRRMLGWPLTAP